MSGAEAGLSSGGMAANEPGPGPGSGGDPAATPTFEDLMAELEAVTEQLAAGDAGIERAAELYERALQLHNQASERLQQVRARVDGLTAPGGTGPAGG